MEKRKEKLMRYSDVVELQALIHTYMRSHFIDEQWGMFAKYLGIEKAVDKLPVKDRKVLKMRWGLVEGGSRTLEEVGKEFGVTRERIRQIEQRSIKTILKYLKTK